MSESFRSWEDQDALIMSPEATSVSSVTDWSSLKFPASQTISQKIIIVGNKGAGKTAFVRRFVAEELGVAIANVTPTASSSCSLQTSSSLQGTRRRSPEGPPKTISTNEVPKPEVGLDIYELELRSEEEANSRALRTNANNNTNANRGCVLKLSIWDFTSLFDDLQPIPEIFFTENTLYVVVWDMAAKDITPMEGECVLADPISGNTSICNDKHSGGRSSCEGEQNRTSKNASYSMDSRSYMQTHRSTGSSAFKLGYDSDSDDSDYDYYDDCDVDTYNQEEMRRKKRMLEKDIDRKVQSWVDRIQATSPGATILPIATHADHLLSKNLDATTLGGDKTASDVEDHRRKEAKSRCRLLKERITSNEARKVEGLEHMCQSGHNRHKSHLNDPNISRPIFKFGDAQTDGQVLPHAISVYNNDNEDKEEDDDDEILSSDSSAKKQTHCKNGGSFVDIRDFVLRNTLVLATMAGQKGDHEHSEKTDANQCDKYTIGLDEESAIPILLTTAMIRDARQNLCSRSKIVHREYFTKKLCNGTHRHNNSTFALHENRDCITNDMNEYEDMVAATLHSLTCLGELCYFADKIPASLRKVNRSKSSDVHVLHRFVVLDPTWLMESINFILQCGRSFVEETSKHRSVNETTKSKQYRATNFPTIGKEEIKRRWKNRSSTKEALAFAEHYFQFQCCDEHNIVLGDVADQVFEFIQFLLVEHDIIIPLSYQESGSRHYFLPSLLKETPVSNFNADPMTSNITLDSSTSVSMGLSHSSDLTDIDEEHALRQTCLNYPELEAACHGFVFVDTAPHSLMARIIVHSTKSLGGILNRKTKPRIIAREINCWKDSFRWKLQLDVKGEEQAIEINSVLLESGSITNPNVRTGESILLTYVEGCHDNKSSELWRQTCFSLRVAMQNAIDEISGIAYKEEAICPECLRKKPMGEIGTWSYGKLRSAVDSEEAFIRCRHGHRIEPKLCGILYCQFVEHPQQRLGISNGLRDESSPTSSRIEFKSTPRLESTCYLGSTRKQTSHHDGSLHREHEETEVRSEESDCSFNQLVAILLQKCKAKMNRTVFKKSRLNLENLNMIDCQIPIEELVETKFGRFLRSLSLAHNRLETLPKTLVTSLSNLRSLNVSHCLIYELPKRWNLPVLKKLDVSHNLLIDFPEEVSQERRRQ
jgi:hypothetical protein